MAEQDISPPTITEMKIPIIRKGEYDIWSMRMRQYICYTNHNLWDVIVNGDLEEEAAPSGDQSAPPAPKTAKQLAAKRNQERVKSILLLAIPDEYIPILIFIMFLRLLKSLWHEIKSSVDKAYERFQKLISQLEVHGAPVSKEDINQKFLRSLPPYRSQEIISLIMRNKPDIDQVNIDDLYNNLRVYEDEMKKFSSSTSNYQNLAFLSSENTSSTNEVSSTSGNFEVNTAGGSSSSNQVSSTPCADEVVCSFFAHQATSPPLDNEDLQQIDQDDLEELDIQQQVAILTVKVQRFECKSRRNQGKRSNDDNGRRNATTNEPSSQALVAQDGLGGYDWSNDFDLEPVNYALMAISSSSSSSSSDNEILVARKDELAWGEKYEFQNYELKCKEIKIDNLKMELEKVVKERDESETDSEISMSVFDVRSSDEENTPANDRFYKADGYHAVPPPITGNFLTSRADISFAGLDEYAIRKKIIESKTTKHNTKTSEPQTSETVVNIEKLKSVSDSVVPKLKIIRDKVIIEDWNSDNEDDVFEVNTVSPGQEALLPIKRSYYTKPAFRPVYRPKDLKPDVKTFRVKNMTTIGTRAVVSKGKVENVLKKAKWVWRPKMNYQDHVYKYNGSYMLKKFEYVDPKGISKIMQWWIVVALAILLATKLIFHNMKILMEALWLLEVIPKEFNLFSVSQMCDKKNSVLFTESECLILSPSFKLLDESQVVLRAPRKDGVYSLDLKNIVPSGGITCLYANATADESKLWHRRLGHVNFKNINKLVKGHLVRGLPSKVFMNDHTCVACKKGKQHKASCKAKLDRIIRKPLELLHMDLFGPVSIESINKKRYCLVVTDDFSRFSWRQARGSVNTGLLCTVLGHYDLNLKTRHLMNIFIGKFNRKSDKGYFLGYSTSSKAFRVYNKRTKRVEENLHINFLEDQPNVAGIGPNWVFDLDFLTNSMNYIPVSVENQVNVDAGTQDSYVTGSSGKDKRPTQEYILLPLQPHRTRILVKDAVQDTQEQPSENASPDKDIQDLEDVIDKEGQHQMPEDDQVWQDELEMMVTQELVANCS
ncbi:putative ribonuclease H-like domain-containing protein [Tanacetum coccineum]|uniref:Ribonuclease H-like domain-containing protein n=1 Tax=Tanacetum coccineum TaxID=301880 RepID=A0ABQ5BIY7_9ASTR